MERKGTEMETESTKADQTVHEIVQEMIDLELIEDRGEYGTQDFAKGYPELSQHEVLELFRVVQLLSGRVGISLSAIRPDVIKEYLTESEHSGWDGFEPNQVTVIWSMLYDLCLFAQNYPDED